MATWSRLLITTAQVGLLLMASCTAFKKSIIQAPTPEEQKLAEGIEQEKGFEGRDWTNLPAPADEKKPTREEILSRVVEADRKDTTSLIRDDAPQRYASKKIFLHPAFRSGDAYCEHIMLKGQKLYKTNLRLGTVLSLLGATGTAAATAWTVTSEDKSSTVPKITLATSSALITIVGVLFLGRASAAATASGEAGLAFVPELAENKKWEICLDARSHWLGSNSKAIRSAIPSGGD
jgi:hypothetical protein